MIIGIDASRANHEQRTGVENYAFHVIEEMKKMQNSDFRMQDNEEIKFILYTDKPLQGELAKLSENWEERVLRWLPQRLWTQIRLSWEMLVNPPDVLFIPAHVFPLIHPKKTVMTVHDIAAIRFPESYNWFERWYSTWSARKALQTLWKIIVPSEFTKKELSTSAHQHISTSAQEKIYVIQHGYDERYKKLDNNETMTKQILDKYSITKPFIMSVGRLEEKKNTVRIVKAFEKLKERLQTTDYRLQILLVGKPGFGYEAVKQAIENSSSKDDIITPGFVSEEDMPHLMNAAEVFLFPSLYEGFGLPVLESMACGTSVVASKGNSLEEVGGDACVYVDPMNVEEIVQGIVKLMQNEDFKIQNIKKGLERVKDFSWETCAKETSVILSGELLHE